MMSKELIERLRADAESTDDIGLCADAADRIEELERKVASRDAEVAKLKDDNEYLYVAAIERDQLRAHINDLREALENCRLLAARHRKEEWAGHVLRLCESAGVAATALRSPK